MANKRKLKKAIDWMTGELMLGCTMAGQTIKESSSEDVARLLEKILRLQGDLRCRISHPEPGMTQKAYFKALRESMDKEIKGILEELKELK
ncbi:MAG: hypothetical protein LUC86_07910 [Prevotellaceae bacterium]|nr:hypothetical protein [Prevotellaceae bacterium]MCD8304731.1 hypothetical protein [Prevotellaceae bacterium]